MKVYIPQHANYQYSAMFQNRGWTTVSSIAESDLVLFIGGADVNPALYNEKVHATTHYNHRTDEIDVMAYKEAQKLGKPCVGICRGGQFLNVMNNGSLYQDVDNHTRSHLAYLLGDDEGNGGFVVSSTHHQMMIPSRLGYIRLIAKESNHKEYMPLQTSKEYMPIVDDKRTADLMDEEFYDVESVYYPQTQCYCFQPHPEFDGYEACTEFFFNEINNLLLEK